MSDETFYDANEIESTSGFWDARLADFVEHIDQNAKSFGRLTDVTAGSFTEGSEQYWQEAQQLVSQLVEVIQECKQKMHGAHESHVEQDQLAGASMTA